MAARWTNGELDRLRAMFTQGMQGLDIAVALDRPVSSVLNKCQALNLSFRARDKAKHAVQLRTGETLRKCLGCSEQFASKRPPSMNRICPACKSANENRIDTSIYGVVR